jgi:hypothetical protein
LNENQSFTFDLEGSENNFKTEAADNLDWERVISIATFASRETLATLVEKLDEKADFDKIKKLAPFLSITTIERLILSAFNNGERSNWEVVVRLVHFSSRETLEKLISKFDLKKDFHKIVELAPFLGSEAIDNIINNRL